MTTATSTRGKTEFLVSQHTSSKELFDQLNELKADKGANADLPIRAYEKGRNGITLKIYNKKTSAGGLLKATANPQRVSARLLVITTIENILELESKKSTNEDKEKITQVLGNIKAKKSRCINHDIKIPDLITDLSELKSIWDKTSANSKPTLSPSHTTAPPPQKNESTKQLHAEKNKSSKVNAKIKSHTTVEINPTHKKNKSSASTAKKPNLKIREAENNATITPTSSTTPSTTTIQTKQVERSTNPFDDSPTLEPQTPAPAAPTFFQRVSNFFKPVTNFFASVRRFLGFN